MRAQFQTQPFSGFTTYPKNNLLDYINDPLFLCKYGVCKAVHFLLNGNTTTFYFLSPSEFQNGST